MLSLRRQFSLKTVAAQKYRYKLSVIWSPVICSEYIITCAHVSIQINREIFGGQWDFVAQDPESLSQSES